MSLKPGRNDPCYCGSGKKYKRCHLLLDEKAPPAVAPPQPEHRAEQPAPDDDRGEIAAARCSSPPPFDNPGEVFKLVMRSGLFKRDPELRRLFNENETLFNYMGNQQEIEDALAKLEPYEKDFQQLFDDEAAFLRRCDQLFGEKAFDPLRCTAADLQRAFKAVGFPTGISDDKELRKIYLKALRFLTSKERRNHLSLELMLRLPEYVKQGRYLDARLVAFASQVTDEDPKEVNFFLLRMFYYGVVAWEDHQNQARDKLLRKAGFYPKEGMSPDEIDAWAKQALADPVKAARLEKLAQTHPDLLASSAPTFETLARQSVKLLDREDARRLWLSQPELEPWVPFLREKLQLMLAEYGPGPGKNRLPKARQKAAIDNVYLPALREVTKAIFTTERIRKLANDLKTYRNDLFAAGEQTASYCASCALHYVEPENDPALNMFLVNLCAKSLHGIEPAPQAESPTG